MCELEELRAAYPDWRFGSLWAGSESGPGVRALWATRGPVVLADFTPEALRAKIAREQSRLGET